MKRKILSIFLIICMLLTPCAIAQETQTASENNVSAVQYTPEMQKYIIKTYAQFLATNYYYGIEDEELLYAVICNMIDEGGLDIGSAVHAMINVLHDEYAEYYTPEEFATVTENVDKSPIVNTNERFAGISTSLV